MSVYEEIGICRTARKRSTGVIDKDICLDENTTSSALRYNSTVTITNEVSAHYDIVAARKIDRRFALEIFTVE